MSRARLEAILLGELIPSELLTGSLLDLNDFRRKSVTRPSGVFGDLRLSTISFFVGVLGSSSLFDWLTLLPVSSNRKKNMKTQFQFNWFEKKNHFSNYFQPCWILFSLLLFVWVVKELTVHFYCRSNTDYNFLLIWKLFKYHFEM